MRSGWRMPSSASCVNIGGKRMLMSPPLPTSGTTFRDQRLRAILDLHFHSTLGSPYWLARQERLGWRVRERVRTVADLALLGPTPLDELRRHPVGDFIPRGLHAQRARFI